MREDCPPERYDAAVDVIQLQLRRVATEEQVQSGASSASVGFGIATVNQLVGAQDIGQIRAQLRLSARVSEWRVTERHDFGVSIIEYRTNDFQYVGYSRERWYRV